MTDLPFLPGPATEPPRPVEIYLPPTGYRLDQLVASFLADPRFGANTAEAYRRDLRTFLQWCDRNELDPLTLGLPEINVFSTWLKQTPSERTGRVRSDRTIARAVNAISSFYTYLNRAGAMHYQPAAGAGRPKVERKQSRTRPLTEQQAASLCRLAPDEAPRTWPPLCAQLTMHLLVDLGARVSELCNADLGHLGYRVDGTGTEWRVIELRMKGGKLRYRPVPLQLTPLLDAWLAARIAAPDQQALLVDRDGDRVTRARVDTLVKTLAAAANVPQPHEISPHSARHAFNTIARLRGASLEGRQHALGHASPETTQLYDHAGESLAADPAHLVASATFTGPTER
ncbi:tyrosine-type recombinase/integrase [Sciscionella sediminilitoris]|uniref:tyrosine-type recombinase/integrase n=1 Tax=Sciscionella sediminilitoris TaxID=1445613 RepID=UPI00068B5DDC|nr:tyrosine-type recombinase/integrase [Sciscionella sp. SE31]